MVEHQAFGRRDQGSKPPLLFRSLGNFAHPTLPVQGIIFKASDRFRSPSLALITHLGSNLSFTLTVKITRSLVGPADKLALAPSA